MFKEKLENIKRWYRGLPDKKRYIEFITALLTVPVLMTVLISNISNINNNKRNELAASPTAAPTEKIIVITEKVENKEASATPTLIPSPTEAKECKREVGPVKISSPAEGQLVSTNPVCININYPSVDYCSVNWSYRINEGDWSSYNDKEICIYNLNPGPQQLELRVKSTQSDDEITLVRNFYYKTKDMPTPTPTIAITSPTGP